MALPKICPVCVWALAVPASVTSITNEISARLIPNLPHG